MVVPSVFRLHLNVMQCNLAFVSCLRVPVHVHLSVSIIRKLVAQLNDLNYKIKHFESESFLFSIVGRFNSLLLVKLDETFEDQTRIVHRRHCLEPAISHEFSSLTSLPYMWRILIICRPGIVIRVKKWVLVSLTSVTTHFKKLTTKQRFNV